MSELNKEDNENKSDFGGPSPLVFVLLLIFCSGLYPSNQIYSNLILLIIIFLGSLLITLIIRYKH